jgi:hypothetical protein
VTTLPDERPDDSDPKRVLSGFLTETTRRVRRTLLAVTTVAFMVRLFGVRLTKLSLLGNELTIPDERWLPIGLFVAVAYFWVSSCTRSGCSASQRPDLGHLPLGIVPDASGLATAPRLERRIRRHESARPGRCDTADAVWCRWASDDASAEIV